MEVEYIFRPAGRAFSIECVFNNVIGIIEKVPFSTVHKSEVRPFRFWPFTIVYNIFRYAFKSYKSKRIFHITGDIQYVACLMNPKNTVMTIHDLVPLYDPDVPWHSKYLCYWLWYYFPLKRLKYITCISQATREDLIGHFPWCKDKAVVIENSYSPEFLFSQHDFNFQEPVILHIGTKSNKNLERVIEALHGIPCTLVIIGKLTEIQSKLLQEFNVEYENYNSVSDEEIRSLYNSADIVSFPSLYEGFGMPVIEAQIVGRPVVSSNIEPLVSVSGGAAVLVDPKSVDSIREGFMNIINNPSEVDSLITRGLQNAERFSSESIANNYCKFYESMLSQI